MESQGSRGGKADGAAAGVPQSQLAVLPGATHLDIFDHADLLLPLIVRFLDRPLPEAGGDSSGA
jgi:hypothetical protein